LEKLEILVSKLAVAFEFVSNDAIWLVRAIHLIPIPNSRLPNLVPHMTDMFFTTSLSHADLDRHMDS
jgi:hypothetical protein